MAIAVGASSVSQVLSPIHTGEVSVPTLSPSTSFVIRKCDNTSYVKSLAPLVENSPKVILAAQVGSNWILAFASNESGTASDLTTSFSFADVAIYFYSFATPSEAVCTQSCSIVYQMLVKVSVSSNGSYNISGLTVYAERFYPNGTSNNR